MWEGKGQSGEKQGNGVIWDIFALKKGAHDAPSNENQVSGRADDDESSIASSSGESLSIASKRGTPKCR